MLAKAEAATYRLDVRYGSAVSERRRSKFIDSFKQENEEAEHRRSTTSTQF